LKIRPPIKIYFAHFYVDLKEAFQESSQIKIKNVRFFPDQKLIQNAVFVSHSVFLPFLIRIFIGCSKNTLEYLVSNNFCTENIGKYVKSRFSQFSHKICRQINAHVSRKGHLVGNLFPELSNWKSAIKKLISFLNLKMFSPSIPANILANYFYAMFFTPFVFGAIQKHMTGVLPCFQYTLHASVKISTFYFSGYFYYFCVTNCQLTCFTIFVAKVKFDLISC
jgi:hypothetical protein